MSARRRGIPGHFWLGLGLVAVAWPLSWSLTGPRTHVLFFPLWLGYVLVVDAWVARRRGASLLTASPARFAALFAASIPAWWLFELVNRRLGNWVYLGRDEFSDLEFFLFSSLSFSTVIPAVFETAQLLATLPGMMRFAGRRPWARSPRVPALWLATGALLLALLVAWPRVFFPATWLAFFFLLDPICYRLGRPSILASLRAGDRRPALALGLGALVCGFFWELWNVYSYPKWVYRIPYFDFWYLFEMPALGYLGYPPFGVELYPLAHLLLPRRWAVPIAPAASSRGVRDGAARSSG